jgi:hypothetical protein
MRTCVRCAGPGTRPSHLGRAQSGIHHLVKFVFIPISILGGLVAGAVSRKVLDRIWGLFDEEAPPTSKDRDIAWTKLAVAAVLQGAIFRLMKEVSDHYTRRAFYRTTGKWPGEKKPKPE